MTKTINNKACETAFKTLMAAGMATGMATGASAGNLGTNFNLTLGPASGGLGGTGYVRPQDPYASVFGNPATLAQLAGETDFIFGASYVRVEPRNTHDGSVVPAFSTGTAFNNFVAPTIAVRQKLNDKWTFGMGLGVSAGLASDFRSAPLSPVVTYIVFGANMTASYEVNDRLTVGGGAQLGYGLLEFGLTSNTSVEQDISLRGIAGFTYDLGDIMIGGTYQTKLKQRYKDVVGTGLAPSGQPIFSDISVDQPQEIEIGFATTDAWNENLMFEFNGIWLNYSNADAFEDLWEDQYILAGGVQYTTGDWKLRAGYSYHFDFRKEDVAGATSLAGLNTLLAPVGAGGAPVPVPVSGGLVQLVQATLAQPFWNHQVSSGFGYKFNERLSLDFSATLAFGSPEPFGGNTLSDIWEAHAQFGFKWSF